jgi:uncharacterized membrane protein YGL010W
VTTEEFQALMAEGEKLTEEFVQLCNRKVETDGTLQIPVPLVAGMCLQAFVIQMALKSGFTMEWLIALQVNVANFLGIHDVFNPREPDPETKH